MIGMFKSFALLLLLSLVLMGSASAGIYHIGPGSGSVYENGISRDQTLHTKSDTIDTETAVLVKERGSQTLAFVPVNAVNSATTFNDDLILNRYRTPVHPVQLVPPIHGDSL